MAPTAAALQSISCWLGLQPPLEWVSKRLLIPWLPMHRAAGEGAVCRQRLSLPVPLITVAYLVSAVRAGLILIPVRINGSGAANQGATFWLAPATVPWFNALNPGSGWIAQDGLSQTQA